MAFRSTLTIAICLVATCGFAQSAYYHPGYYPGGAYGYGGGTVAGNAAQGAASMIQAAGQRNLNNSQAAKNYEQARSMDYDNRLKGTQTYFEMRKMNKAYRDAERAPRLSTEAAFRMAREAAPDRPTPSQLDPTTGNIQWPVALSGDAFSADRSHLEALFADRAKTGRADPTVYHQINSTTKQMQSILKENIKTMAPDDYLAAKNLLEGLAYEARFPVAPAQAKAN